MSGSREPHAQAAHIQADRQNAPSLGEPGVGSWICPARTLATWTPGELRGPEVVHASHPQAQPWDARRQVGCGPAGRPHCALMNLFCTPEHLAAWRRAHPAERGVERDLGDIGAVGQAGWGYLRSDAERVPAVVQDCRAALLKERDDNLGVAAAQRRGCIPFCCTSRIADVRATEV